MMYTSVSSSTPCDILEALLVSQVRYGYQPIHPQTAEALRRDCELTPELDDRYAVARRKQLEDQLESC